MQQALAALETVKPQNMDPLIHPAKEALRARLAEPEPEPVAWMVFTQDGQSVFVTDNPTDIGDDQRALPLYTAPPTRRPLTDEEIKLAVLNDPIYGAALMSMMRDGVTVAQLREAVSGIARAIERKITGGNDE